MTGGCNSSRIFLFTDIEYNDKILLFKALYQFFFFEEETDHGATVRNTRKQNCKIHR